MTDSAITSQQAFHDRIYDKIRDTMGQLLTADEARQLVDKASSFAQELSRKRKLSEAQGLWLLYLAQELIAPQAVEEGEPGPYLALLGQTVNRRGDGGFRLKVSAAGNTYLTVRVVIPPYERHEKEAASYLYAGKISPRGFWIPCKELEAIAHGVGRGNNPRLARWHWESFQLQQSGPAREALNRAPAILDQLVSELGA